MGPINIPFTCGDCMHERDIKEMGDHSQWSVQSSSIQSQSPVPVTVQSKLLPVPCYRDLSRHIPCLSFSLATHSVPVLFLAWTRYVLESYQMETLYALIPRAIVCGRRGPRVPGTRKISATRWRPVCTSQTLVRTRGD